MPQHPKLRYRQVKNICYWNIKVFSIHQAVCNLLNKNLLTTITGT